MPQQDRAVGSPGGAAARPYGGGHHPLPKHNESQVIGLSPSIPGISHVFDLDLSGVLVALPSIVIPSAHNEYQGCVTQLHPVAVLKLMDPHTSTVHIRAIGAPQVIDYETALLEDHLCMASGNMTIADHDVAAAQIVADHVRDRAAKRYGAGRSGHRNPKPCETCSVHVHSLRLEVPRHCGLSHKMAIWPKRGSLLIQIACQISRLQLSWSANHVA